MPCRAGGVHVNDALVAAAAKTQADIMLRFNKITVHQYVDVLQKFVGHLTAAGSGLHNIAFKGVARVTPDGLVGVQHLYIFNKGQQFALVFRLQRLAPQQRQAVDVARFQALQDLVANLLGEGCTIVEIPRHGIKTVGAAAAAARHKQTGAHTLAVGNVAVFYRCVIHGRCILLCG